MDINVIMDMDMNIAENLQTLIDVKEDIKSAIEEKGVTVSGGLDSYADAIDQIDPGVVNKIYIQNGTKLAYSSWPTETWVEGGRLMKRTLFPTNIDFTYVTDMSYMFYECNISEVPISTMNLSNITNTSYMFYGCGNLKNSAYTGWVDHIIDFTDANNVIDMSYMFASDTSMAGGVGDVVKVDISNCKSIRGLIQGSADILSVYFKGELLSDCDIVNSLAKGGVNGVLNIFYDYRYDYSRLINAYSSYRDYVFLRYDFDQNKIV